MGLREILGHLFLEPIYIGKADITLPFSLLELFLELVLPAAVLIFAYRLAKKGFSRFVRSVISSQGGQNRVYHILVHSSRAFTAGLLVLLTSRLFGARMAEYLGLLLRGLNEPFFVSGDTQISLLTLILMMPVFYFASWGSRWAKAFVESALSRGIGMDEARRFSISNVSRYFVMGILILFGLSIIGIDFSSLTVLFGVMGIGLGFGLQNTVANFFAGLVIIFSRPIKENDRILVNDLEGTVVHIRLLSTIISTLNHETIVVPNSHLVQNKVHNYSYDDRRVMIINPVQVSYGSDLDKVIKVLNQVAVDNPYSIIQSPSEVIVRSFDSSGITVELWTWVADVTNKKQAFSWTNLEIWRAFKKSGVEIPFPQLDLHFITDKTRPDKTQS